MDIIKFRPIGNEVNELYELFRYYGIQDVLPKIQEYLNEYNYDIHMNQYDKRVAREINNNAGRLISDFNPRIKSFHVYDPLMVSKMKVKQGYYCDQLMYIIHIKHRNSTDNLNIDLEKEIRLILAYNSPYFDITKEKYDRIAQEYLKYIYDNMLDVINKLKSFNIEQWRIDKKSIIL